MKRTTTTSWMELVLLLFFFWIVLDVFIAVYTCYSLVCVRFGFCAFLQRFLALLFSSFYKYASFPSSSYPFLSSGCCQNLSFPLISSYLTLPLFLYLCSPFLFSFSLSIALHLLSLPFLFHRLCPEIN